MNTPHPSFDADGYPTAETERAIANWDFRDAPGWLAYIQASWNHHYGRIWREDGLMKMATGGWSGNEAIIEAMRRNSVLWSMLWESSHRGGLDVFREVHDHLPDTGKMAGGKSERKLRPNECRTQDNRKHHRPAMSHSSPSSCSLSFRHWLRGITPGFYTHGSWSWRIGGTLVTHWGNDNVKIYHQGGRHTETHPANTERCREAIQALLSKAEHAHQTTPKTL